MPVFLQPPYWSTRTMWWTSGSSTARRTRTGCQTSWTSSRGPYRSWARKVPSRRTQNTECDLFKRNFARNLAERVETGTTGETYLVLLDLFSMELSTYFGESDLSCCRHSRWSGRSGPLRLSCGWRCCSDGDAGERVEHLLRRRVDVRGRRHFRRYASAIHVVPCLVLPESSHTCDERWTSDERSNINSIYN